MKITTSELKTATKNLVNMTDSKISNIVLSAENDNLIISYYGIKNIFKKTIKIVNHNGDDKISVMASRFFDVIKVVGDDELTIESNEKSMKIKSGKTKYKIPLISSENSDFNFIDCELIDFDCDIFNSMAEKTIKFVSDDETRYFMNGVYFESENNKIKMTATDGRRMASVENEYDVNFDSAIIPSSVLNSIFAITENKQSFKIGFANSKILVKTDDVIFESNLIDGQFPNYKRVIPESQDYFIKLNRIDFIKSIVKITALSDRINKKMIMRIENDSLKITAGSDNGDSYTEMDYIDDCKIEEMEIAINYNFMIDLLNSFNCDNVVIDYSASRKAISVSNENSIAIIMPMSI